MTIPFSHSNKGKQCHITYKLCQEGFCENCYIYQEELKRREAEAEHKATVNEYLAKTKEVKL